MAASPPSEVGAFAPPPPHNIRTRTRTFEAAAPALPCPPPCHAHPAASRAAPRGPARARVQVHDIEDLVRAGKSAKQCPYFTSRELVLTGGAELVFTPYNYLLSPSIRDALGISVAGAVVVFDEAHNIEDTARCGLPGGVCGACCCCAARGAAARDQPRGR